MARAEGGGHHPLTVRAYFGVGFSTPTCRAAPSAIGRSTCSTTSRRPRRCPRCAPSHRPSSRTLSYQLRGDHPHHSGRGEWVDTMTTTGTRTRAARNTARPSGFPTASGDEIEAWHYRPQGDRPHPAVVMAHGFAAVKAGGLAAVRRGVQPSGIRSESRSTTAIGRLERRASRRDFGPRPARGLPHGHRLGDRPSGHRRNAGVRLGHVVLRPSRRRAAARTIACAGALPRTARRRPRGTRNSHPDSAAFCSGSAGGSTWSLLGPTPTAGVAPASSGHRHDQAFGGLRSSVQGRHGVAEPGRRSLAPRHRRKERSRRRPTSVPDPVVA